MFRFVEFQVSSTALAHVVARNPGLSCLKAKGCRNLFQQQSKTDDGNFRSFQYLCEEWCNQLGKTCKLEEIALGWGFSCFSLEALKPAIATLKIVTVGLGCVIRSRCSGTPTHYLPFAGGSDPLFSGTFHSWDCIAFVHHPFP